jgi:fucose permease
VSANASPNASPSRAEGPVVYAAGLVQGVALVTFPAASSILLAPDGFGLSTSQYALMFLPQVCAAILGALSGGSLTARFGVKRIVLAGLGGTLAAMLLLVLAQVVRADPGIAYPVLLVATGCLGAGFGLTVPGLNALAGSLHPAAVDRALLVLNALLGLGTALAPVFVAVFTGLGAWWGLPVLVAVALAALLVVAARLPLAFAPAPPASASARPRGIPARFWLYALGAVLYGVIETMGGNWSQVLLTADLGADALTASLALTAFWAAVTVGRVVFAALERAIPSRWIARGIPLLAAVAYVALWRLGPGDGIWGVAAFALAGLGCSAVLPLTLGFAEQEFPRTAALVTSRLIAAYQLGYGITAFGVGPLLAAGMPLPVLFGAAAVVSVAVAAIAALLTRGRGPETRRVKGAPGAGQRTGPAIG